MFRQRLQLALIHAAVTMTAVPIGSTLNRVMIKELLVPATLVAILASLPYLFSPIQVAVGSFSDRHPLFGLRRTPYILLGLGLCAGGVALAPHAAYAFAQNWWAGLALSLLAFGLWGMGFNFSAVCYFSLASELSGEQGRSRTIAVMFFLMVVSIILISSGLSRMLDPFSPEALARAFTTVALVALALGLIGVVKLEPRFVASGAAQADQLTWDEIRRLLAGNRQVRLFFLYLVLMLTAILGQDILLEPFAAHAFEMPVRETTRLTSIWGTCMLICLVVAGVLENRVGKLVIAQIGAWGAAAAFVTLIVSGVMQNTLVFYGGLVALGLATGLATVSNLSLMLDMTRPGQIGLFIGAWGTANAFSRLLGNVLSGALRDVVNYVARNEAAGYLVVFGLLALMLVASLILLRRIDVRQFRARAAEQEGPSAVERAAIANGA
jgi:BCD family chlorophyll transporter-like MFS transporter